MQVQRGTAIAQRDREVHSSRRARVTRSSAACKMNVAERAIAAPEAERVPAAAEAPAAPPGERQRARSLRPLVSLFPYVARYRWHAIAALVALLAAALATLVVPVAIR